MYTKDFYVDTNYIRVRDLKDPIKFAEQEDLNSLWATIKVATAYGGEVLLKKTGEHYVKLEATFASLIEELIFLNALYKYKGLLMLARKVLE